MTQRRLLLPWLLVLGSGVSAQSTAAPPEPGLAGLSSPYAGAIVRARTFVRDTMRVLGSPGASVTVMQGGRVLWSEGFGFADLEQGVAATPSTRFRIGSVSKPLTAAALGLLVEQGKLDLDAPVQRYVPSFPVKRYPITVRQVAGHLAGIRHYRGDEFGSQRHYANVTDALAIFKDDSLLFRPGTQYSYSTYGWILLSAVVEGASGQPFLTYMQQHVLEPAGLRHTVAEYTDSLIPGRARFYARRDSLGEVLNASYVDNSNKWAGGGFLSTTEDLARFGTVMLDGSLLRPETVRLLWTSQRTADGKETGYGIGWGTQRDSTGRWVVSHSGGAMGGTAYLLIYPREKLVVAILVNSDDTFIHAAPKIAGFFLTPTHVAQ